MNNKNLGIVLAFVVSGSFAMVAHLGAEQPLPGIEPRKPSGSEVVLGHLRRTAGDLYDGSKVGDFRLLDLDADGRMDLVASLDFSGRDFFNTLIVIRDVNGTQPDLESMKVWNMESLAGAMVDLDGDERIELIVRKALTPYSGAGPMATWIDVYTLEGNRYSEAAARYGEFYEKYILPSLEKRGGGNPLSQNFERTYAVTTSRIEYAKTLRVIWADPTIGLDDALVLAASRDPIERVLAAGVLADFGPSNDVARTALNALTRDQDPQVAALARVRSEALEP